MPNNTLTCGCGEKVSTKLSPREFHELEQRTTDESCYINSYRIKGHRVRANSKAIARIIYAEWNNLPILHRSISIGIKTLQEKNRELRGGRKEFVEKLEKPSIKCITGKCCSKTLLPHKNDLHISKIIEGVGPIKRKVALPIIAGMKDRPFLHNPTTFLVFNDPSSRTQRHEVDCFNRAFMVLGYNIIFSSDLPSDFFKDPETEKETTILIKSLHRRVSPSRFVVAMPLSARELRLNEITSTLKLLYGAKSAPFKDGPFYKTVLKALNGVVLGPKAPKLPQVKKEPKKCAE